MAKSSAIIDNFSKGEVSPLSLAKLSSAEAKDGLAFCENMIPDPRGPIVSRQGFRHVGQITSTDKYCSIFSFEMYEGKTLAIVLHDDKADIYNASTMTYMQQVASPYTADLLHGVTRDQHLVSATVAPDASKIYFLHGSVTPWVMTIADLSPIQTNLVSITFAAVAFTSKPAEWTGDNNPTALTFFQDRSWWAGLKLNPETFYGSKTEFHEVMTLGTGDNDAMKFVLQQHGLIKWLTGHKDLLLGTAFGEYIVTSSAGVVTPSDVQIDIQSAYGSKTIQPEFIGDEVLYISPDGRKLRSMWWRWVESGWKSVDLTFYADHLTVGKIKDIAYVRDPFSTIYLLTGTNQILSCSYLRTNDANSNSSIGFSRITPATELTKVVAMATIQDRGNSSLWIGAQTMVNGTLQLHLMKQDQRDLYSEKLILLDNFTETVMVSGATTVTGLTHLEGQTVSIVADNAQLSEQTVIGGTITLDDVYDIVVVGHGYTQTMTTLPFIVYAESMGHQLKMWNKYWISMLNSFPPLVNGKRTPTRNSSTPMGSGEPDMTGLTQVEGNGWDREGKITIIQDVPRSLMILGIYGEVALRSV